MVTVASDASLLKAQWCCNGDWSMHVIMLLSEPLRHHLLYEGTTRTLLCDIEQAFQRCFLIFLSFWILRCTRPTECLQMTTTQFSAPLGWVLWSVHTPCYTIILWHKTTKLWYCLISVAQAHQALRMCHQKFVQGWPETLVTHAKNHKSDSWWLLALYFPLFTLNNSISSLEKLLFWSIWS